MSGLSRERRERLLKVRRTGEGIEHGRWARAQMELAARRAETDAIAAKRDAVADEIRSQARGPLNLASLRIGADCRDALARGRENSEAAARQAEREAEARRFALQEANGRVRAIKKLAERCAAEEARLGRAAEARERDDRPSSGARA
jgi:flagellar FliJ-like protein